jgi:hypothetical protein
MWWIIGSAIAVVVIGAASVGIAACHYAEDTGIE